MIAGEKSQTAKSGEYRRRDIATLEVQSQSGPSGEEYRQEKEEEEYFYIQPRPLSQQSTDSATIHFLTDDRDGDGPPRGQKEWPEAAKVPRSGQKERVVFTSQVIAMQSAKRGILFFLIKTKFKEHVRIL